MIEFNVGDLVKYYNYSERKDVYGIVTEKISYNVVAANITHPMKRTVSLHTDQNNLDLVAKIKKS